MTLTATPEPDAATPRVRIDVTDTTGSTSVVVSRMDADGRSRLVRTSDGEALPISGGTATVYDYEAPYGTQVIYSTNVGSGPTAQAMLDVLAVWLVHPGVPSRSQPVDLRVGTNQSEEWAIDQGVFAILEREDPMIVTGGARTSPASSLIVKTDTAEELAGLRLLLSDGSPLLLNVHRGLGLGLPTSYIAVGTVRPARPSTVGTDGLRHVELPYQTVGRPGGGTQAAIVWDDIATRGADDYTAAVGSQYLTWQAIADAGVSSWAELAAPTN